ncbi:MAG: endo alpha-1,4 polygalactosaminidase [Rhodospirillaceae bacterium]|nr:endo alpha-1,4 polygalactosaminidase [Rhodospirillaceae bacterium]
MARIVALIAALMLWAAPAVAQSRLSSVETWMYQLQDLDAPGAVEALAATAYDLLVLEPGQNFRGWSYDTAGMVPALATRPDGSPRLLLAYIDIGEAEDYRDYWRDDWVAPTAGGPGSPAFLITVDPDGWSGNYPVAYWDPAWQALWLGPGGIVADLARLGFDGVYLDWVEAYDDEAVIAAAARAGVNAEAAMIGFIEQIGAAGRAVNPDFLVVAQNAHYLLDADPPRYLAAIDALAVEDTWFHGDGDADWDDPAGGDRRDRYEDDYSTAARLAQIARYRAAGLPVFSVDYALQPDNVALVYREAPRLGLVPLVTRVALSRLTETPPPWLGR